MEVTVRNILNEILRLNSDGDRTYSVLELPLERSTCINKLSETIEKLNRDGYLKNVQYLKSDIRFELDSKGLELSHQYNQIKLKASERIVSRK